MVEVEERARVAGVEDGGKAHAHGEGVDHEPPEVLRGSQNGGRAEWEVRVRTLSRMSGPSEGTMAMFGSLVISGKGWERQWRHTLILHIILGVVVTWVLGGVTSVLGRVGREPPTRPSSEDRSAHSRTSTGPPLACRSRTS